MARLLWLLPLVLTLSCGGTGTLGGADDDDDDDAGDDDAGDDDAGDDDDDDDAGDDDAGDDDAGDDDAGDDDAGDDDAGDDDAGDDDAGDDDAGDDDAGDPCPSGPPESGTDIDLQLVAQGLGSPVCAVHAGDGSGRIFVCDQAGRIYEVSPSGSTAVWLDIRFQVDDWGERGLLSIAFHPDYASNGRVFAYYTDVNGDTVVSEFTSPDPAFMGPPLNSERVVLEQDQPDWNHNGGQLAFGPDGYLYIGLGDGGGANDAYGNGQRPGTFLAKILRIDVDGATPYAVPADNPFVGDADMVPEAWAWGLRNPWRFSFDSLTGDLWIADVGQGSWEEIDVGVAGANYGWPEMEGNNCFQGPCDPTLYEAAVHEYGHVAGISIIGGHVYRGCRLPDLVGYYFYSDYNYVSSPLWSMDLSGQAGPVTRANVGALISSFGQDENGELLVCDHGSGRLLRMVPD